MEFAALALGEIVLLLHRCTRAYCLASFLVACRLYLELYVPELAAATDAALQTRLDIGTAVGELVRRRFPNGRLIAHDHEHHADAAAETRALLDDPSAPALYEAAFTHDDVAVRADILVRAKEPRRADMAEHGHTLACYDADAALTELCRGCRAVVGVMRAET